MLSEVRAYSFDESGLEELQNSQDGNDWPVVYLIHNDKAIYIGETTSAAYRMSQHLKNDEKKSLNVIEIVFDKQFNKSVILDYEQRLIKYFTVDGRFKTILNKNKGQQASHDYYDRQKYRNDFPVLWNELRRKNLATKTLDVIENDNIFKFSPYNSLTGEQNGVAVQIIKSICASFTFMKNRNTAYVDLVDGSAGTGKTVLAISLINSIINATKIEDYSPDEDDVFDEFDEDKLLALRQLKDIIQKERGGKPFKIGLVFPMPGIRKTVSRVFKMAGNGLTSSMVIGPNDVVKEQYDILFVDESHRLSKRKNLTNYNSYDDTCRKLGLDKESTNQLEWILKSAKHVVLFYDKHQSVKSSDITYNDFHETLDKYANPIKHHVLLTQMRCEGGDTYLKYVSDIMHAKKTEFKQIENYQFRIFDDVDDLVNAIRKKDDEVGLSKTVAGFSWEWVTKPAKAVPNNMDYYNGLVEKGEYDIPIQGHKYIWNLSNEEWITREDSHYTIGCIHTSQGYDMNYVGVIFGKEIDYNPDTKEIEIDLKKFKDKKVKAGTDEKVVKDLILNTYTTILARGIKGCYVYAYNKHLQDYLKDYIVEANDVTLQ